MVYLLNSLPNSLLVPPPSSSREIIGLAVVDIVSLLSDDFISAVGHQSTAHILSEKLGLHIAMNRIQVNPQVGDILIIAAFVPPRRLAEGEMYTEEEILNMEIRFCKISF